MIPSFSHGRLGGLFLHDSLITVTPREAYGTVHHGYTQGGIPAGRLPTYTHRVAYTHQGASLGLIGNLYPTRVPLRVYLRYIPTRVPLRVYKGVLYPPGCLSGCIIRSNTHQGASQGV